MGTKRIRVDWDTESEGRMLSLKEAGVTEIVEVPEDVYNRETEDEGAVCDWLSDEYGWCVFGWEDA